MSLVVEEFFGVYLLYCLNPKYKGRIYIGYTVNPNRRIKQHNTGKQAGGAHRTSKRGPWTMVMIIYGFPNSIAALRFEWAWQHPHRSRRLNQLPKKRPKESSYDFHLRILSEMLRVGPWNRLPLAIRWLNDDYKREFPVEKCPPIHMPISCGSVETKRLPKDIKSKEVEEETTTSFTCQLCFECIENKKLSCLNPSCDFLSHVLCLGNYILESGEYVPIEGNCPKCEQNFLWGDIIRKYKGCDNLNIVFNGIADDFYSSDSE